MKNNLRIIIAVIILIFIVAIGGILFMKYSKAPTQPQTINTQSTKTGNNNSTTASILSLLSGGKNVSCSITYPNNQGAGIVFVSDKKFAGEFTMKEASGREIIGHSVSDGIYVYVWSSAMPTGIKISFADAKSTVQNAQANQGIDINQKVGLKCSPWLPDNSKFIIPSNIEFKDMSQLLKQVQPQTGIGNSPCNQIPAGPAKTACLNTMQSSGK